MEEKKQADGQKTMVLITGECMGTGDDELGAKLMVNYIKNIGEMGSDLWRLVLVNGGVKLTIDGSSALETLQELEASGLTVLVCTTCLNHFNLLEKKKVGLATNMPDIVNAMQFAEKVITL